MKVGGPAGEPCCSKRCCAAGTRYTTSESGWFDTTCFTAWFTEVFLPHAQRIPGRKALIGDNLSSHFTTDVLQLCNENDILFICLPPNSTHLCQPLDVALFGPLKRKWREILLDYKRKNPEVSAVQKPKFPRLLNRLMISMAGTIQVNVRSGFRTCGIVPINRDAVKNKLQQNEVEVTIQNVEVISFLREQRGMPETSTAPVIPIPTSSNVRPSIVQEQQVHSEPGPSSASVSWPAPPLVVTSSVPARTVKRKRSNQITPGKPVEASDIARPATKRVRNTSVSQKKATSKSVTTQINAVIEQAIVDKIRPAVGDSVIVRYNVRKRCIKYGGIVTQIMGEDFNVTFLRAVNAGRTTFVLSENDSSWETMDDFAETVVPFTINNRGQYVFTSALNVE